MVRTLLTLARWCAGDGAAHRVFEPMLADWQRELDHTRAEGGPAHALAIVKGSLAFARGLAVCAITEGVWMPPLRPMIVSVAAIAVTLAISIAVILVPPPPSHMPRDLSMPMLQRWLLIWSVTFVPPVFLLSSFLLRRDVRTTVRHAVVFTLFAGVASALLVVNTTDDALRRRYDTFDAHERMRALELARHRAGQAVYPGGSYQQEVKLTIAERRARFEKYRAQMEKYRYDPPPTWRRRVAQVTPILLSMVFAVMGWTLAGLGAPTIARGIGWWALVFAATIAMTRILSNLIQVPMPRPPPWSILPVFGSILVTLLIGVRWTHDTRVGGES